MDQSAIRELQDGAAAIALGEKLSTTSVPTVALPDHFKLHSLEQYMDARSRYRAKLNTSHIDTFATYHAAHGDETAPVFIDPKKMSALTIFDLGDVLEPLHGEHRATLQLQATAPFNAFLALASKGGHSQRELAEWFEDWRDYIVAIDEEDQDIEIKRLIATIRKITVDANSTSETSVGNFSGKRTAMESIEAKSEAGSLPKVVIFRAEPYDGLPVQEFRFRISIRTGGNGVSFGVFRIQEERDTEKTAEGFVDLLTRKLGGGAIYQGNYSID